MIDALCEGLDKKQEVFARDVFSEIIGRSRTQPEQFDLRYYLPLARRIIGGSTLNKEALLFSLEFNKFQYFNKIFVHIRGIDQQAEVMVQIAESIISSPMMILE